MTENRLELLAPELVARLEKASTSQQRAAAKIASQFALENTGLRHPILSQGLEALELGEYGNYSLQTKLESFVNQMDEIQWILQEKMDEGATETTTYLAAFQQVRAANSLYLALDVDAFFAATESIYEANAATDDLATLKPKILAAFIEPVATIEIA